jgi:hypothetical protein
MFFILLDTSSTNVWSANLITGAGVVGAMFGLIKYLLNRQVVENDKKIAAAAELSKRALEENQKIKDNYLKRFDAVRESVHAVRDDLGRAKADIIHDLGERISGVEREKMDHRVKTAEAMGEIKSQLQNLSQFCRDQLTNKRQ